MKSLHYEGSVQKQVPEESFRFERAQLERCRNGLQHDIPTGQQDHGVIHDSASRLEQP
jgi:hypothetical protein